jgi:hypothetical protein
VTASELRRSTDKVQKHYASLALIAAIVLGGSLILLGYAPLGKGLIAGTLFSAINFWLMARGLPARLGHGRAKTFIISLTSIYGRFAVMALPLIIAVKHPQIAVSTVAIGLFAVPLVILAEHLWHQWRCSHEVNF